MDREHELHRILLPSVSGIAGMSLSTRYTNRILSCGQASALERRGTPIRFGAQLSGERVKGRERGLDRRPVGDGLRRQEANLRQRDIEGAKPPASSAVDELTRLGQERARAGAVAGGQPGVRECRED